MSRSVWKASRLPTHSHGLRDGALFYLLAERFNADTWVITTGLVLFALVWLGEMINAGQESPDLDLRELK